MECLDDDTLTDFIEHAMPPERAAEVEDHVAACAACRRLVVLVVGDLGATELGATTPFAQDGVRIARGTIVGRYVVADVLGEGGMGVVYAAHDPELDRKVAIKVLHAGLGDSEHAARLQREARAIARLAHPNVVTVYDVGTRGDTIFVAMELVAGGTLDAWLQREPRTWSRVLAMFLQAATGLAAAHEAGLVHRDFKPANVLVGTDGRARVTDFGLARWSDDPNVTARRSRPSLTGVTMTGARVGTPNYMPPEQFEGLPTDERSDQFSFAVSLFEGLYGARPFAGDTADEILANITRGAILPAPPASKVPAWLRQAILPALAARPDARYPTFDAFVEALRRDPRTRRRWIAIAVAAPLALAGAVVAGYAHSSPAASPCKDAATKLDGVWDVARRQAIHAAFRATGKPYAEAAWAAVERDVGRYTQAWVTMRTDACEATRSGEQSAELLDLRMQCLDTRLRGLDALASTLARADATTVGKSDGAVGGLAPVDDCANVAWLRARVRLPETPIVRARVDAVEREVARAESLQATGRYAEGLTVAHAAVEAARTIDYAPLTAAAELRLGMLQARSAEGAQAADTIKRAILAAEAGGDDEVAVRAWTTLLLRETGRGNFAPATDAGEHARALLHKLPGADALESRLAFALAALLQQQSKYAEAEVFARRALELARKLGGGRDVATTLDLLSKILADAGRTDEALTLDEQALHTAEQALGPNHPEIAFILDGLSGVQENLDRMDDARATAMRALAIREAALPPDHTDIGASLSDLAILAVELGRYGEGLAYDQRALAIYEKKLGPDHPSVARVRENMSSAELELGRVDAAIGDAQESLRIREQAFGAEHDDVAASLLHLGRALSAKGKLPAALAAIRRAIAIDEHVLGKEHPMLLELHTDLAEVLVRNGQPAAAIAAADRALQIGDAAHVPPVRQGVARFVRARARLLTGDRAGAWTDADTARAVLAPDPASQSEVVELDAWLAAHPHAKR